MHRRGALALAFVASVAPTVWAHRGHGALSVVELDATSGTVRVAHHLEAHDIEPALWMIAPKAQASLDDADALSALVAYLGRCFTLDDAQGRRIALTPAPGASDLAGSDVRFVFTGKAPVGTKELVVASAIFSDIYPDQQNQVNLRRAKVTLTALFTSADTGAQTLTFP